MWRVKIGEQSSDTAGWNSSIVFSLGGRERASWGHAKVKAMIKGSDGQNHGVVESYGVPGGVLMDAQLQGFHRESTRFISAKGCVPLTSKPLEVI